MYDKSVPMIVVGKTFHFSAGHHLPMHRGKCRNYHGHNYILEVEVAGDLNAEGMVIDFEKLEEVVDREIIKLVDHCNLNDLYANPTAENLVIWFWNTLLLAGLNPVRLRLWETPNCYAEVRL